MNKIDSFDGEHAFLSNFFASQITSEYGRFLTAEHLYQASKTNSLNAKERIRLATSPGRAKRMGRKVALRPKWELIKASVMLAVVKAKFEQNKYLAEKLLETGTSELVEGNKFCDNEWGNCICSECENIKGKNLLGRILMQVRSELSRRQ